MLATGVLPLRAVAGDAAIGVLKSSVVLAGVADDLVAGSSDGASTDDTSRCSGEEWIGELLFLLCVSPLPPLEELRGETRPV